VQMLGGVLVMAGLVTNTFGERWFAALRTPGH